MVNPDGRRRRSAVSCALCRKRKIRCNREAPCSNCRRSGSDVCVYDNPIRSSPPTSSQHHSNHIRLSGDGLNGRPREPMPVARTSSSGISTTQSYTPSAAAIGSTDDSTLTAQRSIHDAESKRLKRRIQQLEDQLLQSTATSVPSAISTERSNIGTVSSHLGGTIHVHCDKDTVGQLQGIARSLTHKTRLFGQSHWTVNCVLLIRDILGTIETYIKEDKSEIWAGIEKCKTLARTIKSQRLPMSPSLAILDLPVKLVSDALVGNYLTTTEAIYRILHIPTFRKGYEALYLPNSTPDIAFLVQLKLVLAIGATTFDDSFSLRMSAVRWVHEAQIWASEPKFKARLDIKAIQTSLLLLIAQERVGIDGDTMWVSIGGLLRKAVYIGLHRDPSNLPQISVYAAEMRRRLWNTILELALQSSLTSGGPPFISLGDFDTACPADFDDEQLQHENPIPAETGGFTQTTISIVLRKTFAQRLAVTKYLNDIASSGTYAETLRLDSELRTAFKALSRSLQACNNPNNKSSPSQTEIRMVDFIMHRYLSSLHVPYFGLALHETAYAFSRKVIVESSLKIWRAAFPLSDPTATLLSKTVISAEGDHVSRLTTCSAGFYPTVAIHAALLIALELRTQLQEEESISAVTLRPDLLSVLEESKAWCLRVVQAGETNVKGYLLMSLATAQVEGLMRGLAESELADLLMTAAKKVKVDCVPILEKLAAANEQMTEQVGDGFQQVPWTIPVEGSEDAWSFTTSDLGYDSANAEPMNWMFDGNIFLGDSSLW